MAEEKKGGHLCPVCGKCTFEEEGDYDICPVCGWENDSYQEDFPNEDGANKMSLIEAREAYKRGEKVY